MTKVTVRIHREDGSLQLKTKKIEDDGHVTLRKKGKFDKGWRPLITWKEPKHLRFNRVKYFTDVFQDASETFQMNVKDKSIERPEVTQKEVTRIAKFSVFEKRFKNPPKQSGGTIIYVLLIVQIATIVLMILLQKGMLKL